MAIDRLIELIRYELEQGLNEKNIWKRPLIMVEYDKAVIRALAHYARENNLTFD